MITRTMADLDKKVIKHLHDFPSAASASQLRGATKIEDIEIISLGSSSAIQQEILQQTKQNIF